MDCFEIDQNASVTCKEKMMCVGHTVLKKKTLTNLTNGVSMQAQWYIQAMHFVMCVKIPPFMVLCLGI